MSRVKAHDHCKENKGKEVNISANLLRFKVFVAAMFFVALQTIFVVNDFIPPIFGVSASVFQFAHACL